jgi:hypothetical protein
MTPRRPPLAVEVTVVKTGVEQRDVRLRSTRGEVTLAHIWGSVGFVTDRLIAWRAQRFAAEVAHVLGLAEPRAPTEPEPPPPRWL